MIGGEDMMHWQSEDSAGENESGKTELTPLPNIGSGEEKRKADYKLRISKVYGMDALKIPVVTSSPNIVVGKSFPNTCQ